MWLSSLPGRLRVSQRFCQQWRASYTQRYRGRRNCCLVSRPASAGLLASGPSVATPTPRWFQPIRCRPGESCDRWQLSPPPPPPPPPQQVTHSQVVDVNLFCALFSRVKMFLAENYFLFHARTCVHSVSPPINNIY